MILLETMFQSQINPYLLSIIGVLGLIIAFFITMYISNVSSQLKDIVAKLDLFLTRLSVVESDTDKLELKIINIEKEHEKCQERNCTKNYRLAQQLEKLQERHDELDDVVKEHNNTLGIIARNHQRNHPEDKF
jgi:predicted nuclease with TOPRIM domain